MPLNAPSRREVSGANFGDDRILRRRRDPQRAAGTAGQPCHPLAKLDQLGRLRVTFVRGDGGQLDPDHFEPRLPRPGGIGQQQQAAGGAAEGTRAESRESGRRQGQRHHQADFLPQRSPAKNPVGIDAADRAGRFGMNLLQERRRVGVALAMLPIQLHRRHQPTAEFRVMSFDQQRQRIVGQRAAKAADQQSSDQDHQGDADNQQQHRSRGPRHLGTAQSHGQEIDQQPDPKRRQQQRQQCQQ